MISIGTPLRKKTLFKCLKNRMKELLTTLNIQLFLVLSFLSPNEKWLLT